MIIRFMILVTVLVFVNDVPAPSAMDLTLAEKWGNAKIIRYHVLGSFENDATLVVNEGTNGYAPVKDWLELTFDFDLTESKVVGTPTYRDSPSEMGALRNGAKGCRPPTIAKKYEEFTVVSIKEGVSVNLEIVGRKDYPAAQMTVACTGGNKTVAAKQRTEHINLIIPGVMLLAMGPEANNENVQVSQERDSITARTAAGHSSISPPSCARYWLL